MNKTLNRFFWMGFLFLVLLVFKSFIGIKELPSGDTPFYFSETVKDLPSFPYLWFFYGLGSYNSLLSSFFSFYLLLKLLAIFNLSWGLIEKIAWYWPFLGLGIFSSWYLIKTVLPEARFKFLAPLVYLFNTYILMIVGGGQVLIFLPYATAPLVLGLFISLMSLKVQVLRGLIMVGIALAIQVMFDPRISFLTMGAVFLYAIFQYGVAIKKYIRAFVLPLFIVLGLHFYWLLPSLVLRKASFSPTLISGGWVEFLSFARFSDSFSLLHPNWPENIFGKTYFMRPEFLIIPILAFLSLLFLKDSKSRKISQYPNISISYFASLALIGAFLAKGSKPPFGEVYLWLFNNIPGMNLFRDPTKFYPLVALSYSVLIPFSVSEIYTLLSSKFKITVQSSKLQFKVQNYLPGIFLLLVTVYWLLLIEPAILGQLGGTFKAKAVPTEYIVLKDFINNQEDFFRTFWVPKQQRFRFYSNNHPAISAENFLTETVCLEPFCSLKVEMAENWGEKCFPNDRCYVRELSYFLNPKTVDVLAKMAVKYIIVPFDSEGEIFIAEHQYNHQQREEVEEFLDTIPWLKKIKVADKIAVYEIPSPKDHFFINQLTSLKVNELKSWQMINPTKYLVSIRINEAPVNLVFSETYDEFWQAKIGERIIPSMKYNGLNSFTLDQTGDLKIIVEFAAQRYVYYGLIISGGTISFMLLYYLIYLLRKR